MYKRTVPFRPLPSSSFSPILSQIDPRSLPIRPSNLQINHSSVQFFQFSINRSFFCSNTSPLHVSRVRVCRSFRYTPKLITGSIDRVLKRSVGHISNSLWDSVAMGTKRPFDEELQQFIKHPKQFDYGSKLALFSGNKAPYDASQNASLPGEAGCMLYKFHSGEDLENEYDASDLAGKEFETPAPLSFVNSTSGDAVAGSGAVFCSSLFPEYFEFNFPRRPLVHFDDTYSSLLNCSPRKEIPLGSNHQVDIPILESEVAGEQSLRSGDDSGDRFLGACVIPMPNPELLLENGQDASGTVDCKCLDGGSIRCVQQHVKEAREKLRETFGHEKFMNLGFYDIGEEVAHKWSEDERLFHETIYSNPVSLGKNFWEVLSTAFPSRTKKEIVSYYFNVFMLQRRAVQNRSKLLEIDSDDDEWRGNDREPIAVGGDNEDFVVGSFIGQDVRVDHGDDSSSDDGSDDDNDGGCDVLIGVVDAVEKDSNGFGINEDSHTSLESQQNLPNSCGPVDERLRQENEENNEKGKSLHRNSDGMLGSEYVLEPCDGKIWDSAPYSMGLTNSVDLLSTCSMIEEIFGPSRSDNSIS